MSEPIRLHDQDAADAAAKHIRDTRAEISAEEARASLRTPGVTHVLIAHDAWCQTLKTGNGEDCDCNPETTFYKE
jgi:hypothetical protein